MEVEHGQGFQEGRREALLIAMPVLQEPKHEIIAQALANGMSQTEAYCSAYPKSTRAAASVSATRLLANASVRMVIDDRVSEILREREEDRQAARRVAVETAGIDRAWVIDKLRQNVERAMQAEQVVDSRGVPTGEWTYQGNVANKALELLGKEIGMFRGDDAGKADVADEAVARALAIRDAIDRAFARRETPTTH